MVSDDIDEILKEILWNYIKGSIHWKSLLLLIQILTEESSDTE